MKIFVTGATGWVGSAVVEDLIKAGHEVRGLSRSEEKAAPLAARGMRIVRGTLDDLDVLRSAASAADAVIHTAFNHDFSRFAENAEQDRRAIETLGSALEGSSRPLMVTSGMAGVAQGRPATEADVAPPASPRKSEAAARTLRDRGVRVATVRLAPTVHGIGEHGFVSILIAMARKTGVSAFIDKGQNRWGAVHRSDAAEVYRLALESGVTEAVYHAVAEEGIALKDIASEIGHQLKLPVEARSRDHFGPLGYFFATEMSANGDRTRSLLSWRPTGPTLLADLAQPDYYRISKEHS